MKRKTVMGVHAPPPKPTWQLCVALSCGGLILVILLGLAIDPVMRWLIGFR